MRGPAAPDLWPALPDAAPAVRPGPRRVFLHGFTQTQAAWARVRASSACGGAGDLMVRLPGHDGGRPDGALGWAGWLDRLAAALAARTRRRWHLVGYSMGARLALGLAVRRPARVACLTLIGARTGLPPGPARALRGREEAAWRGALARQGVGAFVAHWAGRSLFASQARLPAARREELARWRAGHATRGLMWALRVAGLAAMPDLWPALGRLPVSAWWLAGARDPAFAPVAAAAAAACPRGRAALVLGAGHDVPLEAPAALASLLDAHEQQAGQAGPRWPPG